MSRNVAISGSLPRGVGARPARTLQRMDDRCRIVEARDGREIEVILEGDDDGMLLMFHHGSPGSAVPSPMFDRVAAERGIRLATFSRAGFGRSSRKEGLVV